MPQADRALTRRGFLGHMAGAYTAIDLLANRNAHAQADLDDVIDHHRRCFYAWCEADEAYNRERNEETRQRNRDASDSMKHSWYRLLEWEPQTIEDVRARFDFLINDVASMWHGCQVEEDELRALARSMGA